MVFQYSLFRRISEEIKMIFFGREEKGRGSVEKLRHGLLHINLEY
jgi:hypothetical protein